MRTTSGRLIFMEKAMAFKTQQEALTVEEQIKNLKSINLTISDEDSVKQFLNDVSYFPTMKSLDK